MNRRDGSANGQRESASVALVPPRLANAPEGERVGGLGVVTAAQSLIEARVVWRLIDGSPQMDAAFEMGTNGELIPFTEENHHYWREQLRREVREAREAAQGNQGNGARSEEAAGGQVAQATTDRVRRERAQTLKMRLHTAPTLRKARFEGHT